LTIILYRHNIAEKRGNIKMAKRPVKHVNSSKGSVLTCKERGNDAHNGALGSVKVDAPTLSKSKVTRNVRSGQIALARAMSKIVKPGVTLNVEKGVPLYHADSKHPGRIVRELDGKRVIGRFVDGKFRISQ
jgi:hypothetical protein